MITFKTKRFQLEVEKHPVYKSLKEKQEQTKTTEHRRPLRRVHPDPLSGQPGFRGTSLPLEIRFLSKERKIVATSNVIDTLNNHISNYLEYSTIVQSQVLDRIRNGSGGRQALQHTLFDQEGYEILKEYVSIIESSDDKDFIFTYRRNILTCGIIQYRDPVLFVMDVDHEDIPKSVRYVDGEFKLVDDEDSTITYYQLYDVYDGLSVGDPFCDIETDIMTPMSPDELTKEFKYWLSSSEYVDTICIKNVDPECESVMENLNGILKKCDVRQCRTCDHLFIMTGEEKKWYADKGYRLPKSCHSCRYDKRRVQRNREMLSQQEQLQFDDGLYWDTL